MPIPICQLDRCPLPAMDAELDRCPRSLVSDSGRGAISVDTELTLSEFMEDFNNCHQLDSLSVEKCSSYSSSQSDNTSITDTMTWDEEVDNNGLVNRIQDLPSTATKMESAEQRMQKSLHNIPHIITLKLIKSLDTDNGWEELGAAAGLDFQDLSELRLEERKMNGSPSRNLLWKLGCLGFTISMLHEKLKEKSRVYEAEIIATYIMEGDRRPRSQASAMSSVSHNSQSLENLLTRMSMSNHTNGAHPQPHAFGRTGNDLPGSEVNFYHPSLIGKSPTNMGGGVKYYLDKAIPGSTYSGVPVMTSQAYSSQTPVLQAFPAQPCHTFPSSSDNASVSPTAIPFSAINSMTSGLGSCGSDPSTFLLRQHPQLGPSSPIPAIHTLDSRAEANLALSVKTSYSYQELYQATNSFSPESILGEGGFGVVYHGHLRGMDCAVKKFSKKKAEEKENSMDQINSELSALLKYQHENIVTLYGYASDGPELCLVYQFLSNGSLEDRLLRKNNTPPLTWERRLNILVGSCRAVKFLHSMGSQPLIHGDIKSANILLDQHKEAKLADLGQSRYATSRSANTGSVTHITLAESTQRQYGTVAYQSPEVKTGCSISVQSDVFAMGVVFLEVCSGLQAYDPNRRDNKFLTDLYSQNIARRTDTEQRQMFEDKSPCDRLEPAVFISLIKLAGKCVKDSKKNRPTSTKLLKGVEELYDSQFTVQSPPKHLNSPTEDDCSQLSSYTSDAPSLNSSHVPSFVMLQEKRLQQISIPNPKNPSVLSSLCTPCEKSSVSHHPVLTNSLQQQATASSYQASFPPTQPRPEALLLQEHYDLMSGTSPAPSHQDLTTISSGRRPCQEGEEDFPSPGLSSDPHKLANMHWFDKHGFTTNVTNSGNPDSSSVSLKSDPVKMAYLKNFDDNIFLSNKNGVDNGNGMGDTKWGLDNNPNVGVGQVDHGNGQLTVSKMCADSSAAVVDSTACGQWQERNVSNQSYVEGDDASSCCTRQKNFDSPADSCQDVRSQATSQENQESKCKGGGFLFDTDVKQRLANRENMFLTYANCIAAAEEEANEVREGEEEEEEEDEEQIVNPLFDSTSVQDSPAFYF